MAEIQRGALFAKLDSLAYTTLDSAVVFCKLRGNPYVELVHWFSQILQQQNSDLHRIVQTFELDHAQLAKDVVAALDRLPRGSTSISDLSSHLENSVERGWVYGSLMFGATKVRTGHLLIGVLKTTGLRNMLLSVSRQFERVNLDTLTERFADIVKASPEEADAQAAPMPQQSGDGHAAAQLGKQEALAKFSVDLTEKARKGEIDPVVGRDEEIRQIIDILMRRRQNNPILTGEAGVGKTAVVEGFAIRIAQGDVPPALKDVTLRTLDIGLLQAGASLKGEFENRLRQVIDEVQASPKPIILFIDEAHTLIGAGGSAGTGDAANLLKPALARGQLRTIAATTWAEYKKYFEKDAALTRRFQVVQVAEPDEHKALLMMRGVVSMLEKHHRVQLLDEAVEAAVKLSRRYIPARQLPDKSMSLLDTACARVAVSQNAMPSQLEDSKRRLEALATELEIIEREQAIGIDTVLREKKVKDARETEETRFAELETRWKKEKASVDRILDIRAKLRSNLQKKQSEEQAARTQSGEVSKHSTTLSSSERATLMEELSGLERELRDSQGDSALILPSVDQQAIATIVADWTGIPVGRMVKDEIQSVLTLADTLERRVVGQRHALDAIASRVQTSRAALDNPSRPIGVFLLCGPSGVGKTETALTLAEGLYGGEQNLITINMSEFQEAHTVSTLKGAPPGYVGYGEGGVLTEAVRRRPYSVVLLDEVEKAHHDVHEVFFQVFDKGFMEDGEGRLIDFKNTLILLTSNVGSELIMSLCKDPELMPSAEGIAKALRAPLLKTFPAALLGRLVVVPYFPLSDAMLGNIIKLQIERIAKRLRDNHDVSLQYGDDVTELIASRCTELESGARMVDAILTHTVLPTLSREILTRRMDGRLLKSISLSVQQQDFAYGFD